MEEMMRLPVEERWKLYATLFHNPKIQVRSKLTKGEAIAVLVLVLLALLIGWWRLK
jgi:hypothetical protein